MMEVSKLILAACAESRSERPERDRLTVTLIWAAVFTILTVFVLLMVYRGSLSSMLAARAFDPFLVFDMKVHYVATKNFSFDFVIDNVFNAQYFLFHPFPGRTYVLAGKYRF